MIEKTIRLNFWTENKNGKYLQHKTWRIIFWLTTYLTKASCKEIVIAKGPNYDSLILYALSTE
jgi:hypothetical protein